MTAVFYLCSKQIYGVEQEWRFNQTVGALVAFLHYFRRLIESNFIHRFTDQPLPWVAIPGIMFYYWFLFGICVMYFFLNPTYSPVLPLSDNINIALGALFMLFEALNFRCHCITAALRKPGSNERGIPQGCGFGIVTVANYMWEGFAWMAYIPLAQTWGALFFSFASWLAMYQRGKERHAKYEQQFPEYAKGKKILIPYIL
jgi:very-long-chain enoyl-CoA reductase